jgi:hypothetical protein
MGVNQVVEVCAHLTFDDARRGPAGAPAATRAVGRLAVEGENDPAGAEYADG